VNGADGSAGSLPTHLRVDLSVESCGGLVGRWHYPAGHLSSLEPIVFLGVSVVVVFVVGLYLGRQVGDVLH
jgi:hypothetical protein